MSKISSLLLIAVCVIAFAAPVFGEGGGAAPCIASFCLGPRVGLEMNEGKDIEIIEILGLFIPIVRVVPGFQAAGMTGCLAGCCFGPRVGGQFKERKIRTMEILQLVYIGRFIIAFEAFQGKTMTEISGNEGLAR